jgi:hypothetical protein
MILDEQELVVLDNRGVDVLHVSSTHPRWTRVLERLERRGLARRTRTIAATNDGKTKVLGGEWDVDRETVALRFGVRRKASEAQRRAAAKATAARLDREANARATVPPSKDENDEALDSPPPGSAETIVGAFDRKEFGGHSGAGRR